VVKSQNAGRLFGILRVITRWRFYPCSYQIIGAVEVGAIGYAAYKFIGCASARARSTSNPYVSILVGAVLGATIPGGLYKAGASPDPILGFDAKRARAGLPAQGVLFHCFSRAAVL
jgi:hypothetical protein